MRLFIIAPFLYGYVLPSNLDIYVNVRFGEGGSKMKYKVTVSLLIISVLLNAILFISLKETKNNRIDGIDVAGSMMVATGNDDNYKSIKKLLTNKYKESVTDNQLKEIVETNHKLGGGILYSYSVINFIDEKGEDTMLLLKLTDVLEDGTIKIQNMKVVPKEIEYFLK